MLGEKSATNREPEDFKRDWGREEGEEEQGRGCSYQWLYGDESHEETKKNSTFLSPATVSNVSGALVGATENFKCKNTTTIILA